LLKKTRRKFNDELKPELISSLGRKAHTLRGWNKISGYTWQGINNRQSQRGSGIMHKRVHY